MGLYLTIHKICGKSYSEIQLLKLAGVHGIHPKLDRSSRIKLIISDLEDEGAVLTISSISIIKLQVVICPGQKVIRNQFILNYKSRAGMACNWVNRQTEYARRFKYQSLLCSAQRDDNYTENLNGVLYCLPLIGYMIWMKFGYLMHPDFNELFKKFLRDNEKKSTQTILNLVETDKEFWRIEGYDWDGIFDLNKGSESERILRSYRPGARI